VTDAELVARARVAAEPRRATETRLPRLKRPV